MKKNYQTELALLKDNWSVAEIKISYHPEKKSGVKITSSGDAYKVMSVMWDVDLISIQEQFAVIFLNNSNEVIGFRNITTGKATSLTIDFQLILTCALLCRAQSVVIAHNHPSGKLEPSLADKKVTEKLRWQLSEFEIRILDHLILTPGGYFSFCDEGLIKHLNAG